MQTQTQGPEDAKVYGSSPPQESRRPLWPKRADFNVGDTIRMLGYETAKHFRVWKIVGHHLGATMQEGTWALVPLDLAPGTHPIHVPCIMLEACSLIERV